MGPAVLLLHLHLNRDPDGYGRMAPLEVGDWCVQHHFTVRRPRQELLRKRLMTLRDAGFVRVPDVRECQEQFGLMGYYRVELSPDLSMEVYGGVLYFFLTTGPYLEMRAPVWLDPEALDELHGRI